MAGWTHTNPCTNCGQTTGRKVKCTNCGTLGCPHAKCGPGAAGKASRCTICNKQTETIYI